MGHWYDTDNHYTDNPRGESSMPEYYDLDLPNADPDAKYDDIPNGGTISRDELGPSLEERVTTLEEHDLIAVEVAALGNDLFIDHAIRLETLERTSLIDANQTLLKNLSIRIEAIEAFVKLLSAPLGDRSQEQTRGEHT